MKTIRLLLQGYNFLCRELGGGEGKYGGSSITTKVTSHNGKK